VRGAQEENGRHTRVSTSVHKRTRSTRSPSKPGRSWGGSWSTRRPWVRSPGQVWAFCAGTGPAYTLLCTPHTVTPASRRCWRLRSWARSRCSCSAGCRRCHLGSANTHW